MSAREKNSGGPWCRECFRPTPHARNPHLTSHSPGGQAKGTIPFRPGKTDRDHASGAWTRRLANRRARGERDSRLAA